MKPVFTKQNFLANLFMFYYSVVVKKMILLKNNIYFYFFGLFLNQYKLNVDVNIHYRSKVWGQQGFSFYK